MTLFKDRKDFLAVLFLFGLVLFIRLVYIPTGKVWYDEIVSITAARQNLGGIYELASAETNTPAYYILLHYYTQLFGDGEVTLRLLSVFFGLLSSFAIFLLAKELADDILVPKIALFLVAVSPFHLYYSHEIRVYSIVIFLSSLTLLSLVKLLRSKGPKIFWDVCYMASYVLGAYLHITYLFYILVLNIFLLAKILHGRRHLLVRNLLLPNAVLVCSVMFFHVVGYPVVGEQIRNVVGVRSVVVDSQMYGATGEDALSTIVRVYWAGVFSPTLLVVTVALLFFGLKKIGVAEGYNILFLLILSTSVLASPRFPATSRYISYAFPAALLLLSSGAGYVWSTLRRIWGERVRISAILTVYTMLLSVALAVQVVVGLRSGGQFCPERLSSFLEEKNLQESVVLIAPSWEHYSLLYYFKSSTPVKGVNPRLDAFGRGLSFVENLQANWYPVVDEGSVADLRNYIKGFRNVWYINSFPPSDPENRVLRWLVENTHLQKIYYSDCSEQSKNPSTKMPVFLFRNEGL